MTDAAELDDLERGYRRWLRWYPRSFRREHEAEILGVLLAGARAGQQGPAPMECLDLLRSAVWIRLRPRVPRSDRAAWAAVKLMYVGAVVELAAAITILLTIGDVRSAVVQRNPELSADQWHAVVAGQLVPLAVVAGIAVGFWLWMAWAIGRGHRWARMVFALFFGLNVVGLLNGWSTVRRCTPGRTWPSGSSSVSSSSWPWPSCSTRSSQARRRVQGRCERVGRAAVVCWGQRHPSAFGGSPVEAVRRPGRLRRCLL